MVELKKEQLVHLLALEEQVILQVLGMPELEQEPIVAYYLEHQYHLL